MNIASKKQFLLSGFTQEQDDRVFAFDGVGADRIRVPLRVRIDTAVARRYGIRPQELPLLCKGLLERNDGTEYPEMVRFAEADMREYSRGVALRAEALRSRKPPRRPVVAAAVDAPPASPWQTVPQP